LGSNAVANDGKQYVKKSTWPETMLATRASFIKPQEEAAEQQPIELGAWFTTGQLKASQFADALFPEDGIDLDAKGSDGKLRWQQQSSWVDGRVHGLPTDGGRGPTYLFRTITSQQPASVPAGFGSDDGLVVWLNGKQVISHDVPRGPGANQDRAVLDFHKGENRLLMKIFNNGGGHGFFFTLNPSEQPSDPLLDAWKQVEADYPLEAGWTKRYLSGNRHLEWFTSAENLQLTEEMIDRAIRDCGREGESLRGRLQSLMESSAAQDDPAWLELFAKVCLFRHRTAEMKQISFDALRLAIQDLNATFPGQYRKASQFLRQVDDLERQATDVEKALASGDRSLTERVPAIVKRFRKLQSDALLANPLLDFDRLLLLKRNSNSPNLGLPQNWQGNCALPRSGFNNEIAVLSPIRPDGKLTTLFKPDRDIFVGDVDLHFDGDRMLFSMIGDHDRFQIWEIGADGQGLRQVTPGDHPDVDNYDACYLPDGRIIFDSTRCFQGVPCVGGGNAVANLFLMDADGSNIRQLCFDQDHNWCPTVLNDGRILYARWEYSDSPHYFTRLLFSMNPDGSNQMQYYGSNSPWPNSTFYARPIPEHSSKVVAVISGHHGVPRMGELLVFDPALGRHQADGAVQRIPGYGVKVKPNIGDAIVNGSWPKFLHPYPLSDKYFLVAMQPTQQSLWGIYLVDIFDNMVLIKGQPGYVLFEPVPLRRTPQPPVIKDRVDLSKPDATIYLSDIYAGDGLKGVPRGTVKQLRVYEFHFAYNGMGGHIHIGIDGPWDARRILGTVPVEKDGSANFKVPANVPIAVQPLDENGQALQIMRSWYTAMPGEVLSCVGCHESQNTTPPSKPTIAMERAPSRITPWYGPARPFSFKREVQPVLDKHCVGCHDGKHNDRPNLTVDRASPFRNFTPSYCALHPYVRRPGPESDYFLQKPLEYHASVSELTQMLSKGHHGVELDREAWDRLFTWIDLNVPDHGTWHEHRGGHSDREARRLEMRTLFANRPENPEEYPTPPPERPDFVKPATVPEQKPKKLNVRNWPFGTAEAQRLQAAVGLETEVQIELAEGITMDLALVPAGEFVMGSFDGYPDEYPQTSVRIDKPFYMGKFEVTNEQFAAFDPTHDVGYISIFNKDHSSRGVAVDRQRQPVIRLSYDRAVAFCNWLSQKTGEGVSLPTEAQWECACRAGTDTPMYYGDSDADFGRFANLADQQLNNLTRRDSPNWIPTIDRTNDNAVVTGDVGRYTPNAWGLYDMHGNVAEWTRTAYRPYPYNPRDGRDAPNTTGAKVVRGGSFYDRPKRARSAFRQSYPSWQKVFNAGFRVVMEAK